MSRSTSRVTRKFFALATAAAGLLALTVGPLALVRGDAASQQPNKDVLALPFKFEGAAGCSAAACHGAPAAKAAPKPAGNEFVTWKEGKGANAEPDHHSLAYKTLGKKESKDIAAKLKLPDAPTASPLCTNCHALAVPADKRMAAFKIEEGVTCAACHGPYEKWAEPHKVDGGANGLRTAAGYKVLEAQDLPYGVNSPEHQKLLKDVGLFDTRPILARAEKCASCHLAIHASLIAAGHPQPTFELGYYTASEPPHWREPAGFWGTKVWAAGQVICLRDAMNQVADRAGDATATPESIEDAKGLALGHLAVFKHLTGGASAAALDAAAKDIKAAGADKAKLATAAKAAAALAEKLAPAVGAMKPDEATTAGLLSMVGMEATEGIHGAEQQAYALSTLFSAYSKGKGKGAVAGAPAISKSIDDLVTATGEFKPDTYAAALKKAVSAITPVLPTAPAIPTPINVP